MSPSAPHPLLREIEALSLPEGGTDEPGYRFDPSSSPRPRPAATPATLLRSRGEIADLGELPRPEGPIPPPVPGAREVAAGVAAGAIDAAELVEQALRRSAHLAPRLRCFVSVAAAPARRAAGRLVGALESMDPPPLAGVPIAHKDLLLTAGIPTRAGSALLADCIPDADAPVVERMAGAGAICIAKTETHEFATGITGLVSAHGPVRNPWGRDRVPGGSSSGSAAAVAAGLVSAATGTDTGGSIRIPAACCGIVGLKPTYDAVSRTGVVPFSWSLDHVGPMARSVDDIALLLDTMRGSGTGRPPRREARELRFAVPSTFLRRSVPVVAEAVEAAAVELQRRGCRRADVELPAEIDQAPGIAAAIFLVEGYALHASTLASHGHLYCPETRDFLELGASVGAERYLVAQDLRARLRDGMAAAMRDIDALLLPTLPITAPRTEQETVQIAGSAVPVRAALTRFTRLFNLTGQPALSLPCGADDEGMPIGLQVVGRAGQEATVLAVAALLEEITGGSRRPPEADQATSAS